MSAKMHLMCQAILGKTLKSNWKSVTQDYKSSAVDYFRNCDHIGLLYLHMIDHAIDFIERTKQSLGLNGNDQIIEGLHGKIERIKNKGLRVTEPSNKTVFSEENSESMHYRKNTEQLFIKANEQSLTAIDDLKPVKRSRSDSFSSEFSAVLELS